HSQNINSLFLTNPSLNQCRSVHRSAVAKMGRIWVAICATAVASLLLESYISTARPAGDETPDFSSWYAKRMAENWTGNGESKSIVAVLKPLSSQKPHDESGEIVAVINPDLKESKIMKVGANGDTKEMGSIDSSALNINDEADMERGPDGRFLINLDWSILDFSKNRNAKVVQAPTTPPPPAYRPLAVYPGSEFGGGYPNPHDPAYGGNNCILAHPAPVIVLFIYLP
ncbi:hypothetical protein Ocin01_18193, partial [Orchesella cincta]